MVPMSTLLIVVLLVILLVLGASFALGRRTEEVEAARDTEYLELEGAYIRYNVIGGGPPVLLVHGWLQSSRVWEALAGRLAQRFTVYTLDLEGFGESDKPLSGYGVRYGSRLLYAFCAHFGLTRTSVVGHDVGGAMVAKLAADHPDVVGRLVLVSTPADDDQIDLPTPLWLATLPLVGGLFYTLGRAFRPLRELWLRPFVVDPDYLTDEVVDDAGRSTPAAVQKTLAVTRREISGGRLARQARIIKVPMLLIAGEDDQIVDPQSVGSWARTADQAEVCLIDDCGHLPMIERTAEFNAQILAFLTGDARYLDYVVERDTAAEDVEGIEDRPPADEDYAAEDYGDGTAAPAGEADDDVRDEGLRGGISRLLGRSWREEPGEDEPPSAALRPTEDTPDEPTADLPLRRRRPRREPIEDRADPFEDGRTPPDTPTESTPFEAPPADPPRAETDREPASPVDGGGEVSDDDHRRYGEPLSRGDGESANGREERGQTGPDRTGDGLGGEEPYGRRTGDRRWRADGDPEDRPAGGAEGSGAVPEIPRDLFKWPEAWQEYRPGERPRRRREDDEPGEAQGPSEEPPDYRP